MSEALQSFADRPDVEIALSIGYDSEVAFSKAFKRYFGMAPGAYRQGRRKQAAKEA